MRNLVICAVCAGLKIDKSMLTGEAEPVRITSEPAGAKSMMLESNNMIFMGCNVTEGSGSGIVIAVGNDNQVRPTDLKLQSEMMTR